MTFKPAVRPGAQILRRDSTHLQIGTSPGVVIRDQPGLLELLLTLDGTREAADLSLPDSLRRAITELLAAGAVVDGDAWDARDLRESRARSLLSQPFDLERRRSTRIAIHADPAAPVLGRSVATLARRTGVGTIDADEPDVLVVIAAGEPARQPFIDASRLNLAHLVVRLVEDVVLVGPTVIPGRTPCLNCHDLHRTDWDPGWAALMPQFGHRSAHHNPPAPGTLTLQAAAIEIVDTLLALIDRTAANLGQIVSVGPHHHDREARELSIHPRCSCALLPADSVSDRAAG